MLRKIKISILKILFKKELDQVYLMKEEAIKQHDAGLHVGINVVLSRLGLF